MIESSSILEKKYKILRTSLVLGNAKNRDDLLTQFESTAREIDNKYQYDYNNGLTKYEYPTKSLDDEEERLKNLIEYIKTRVFQRRNFLDDYKEITSYSLDGLDDITEEDSLIDYQNKLDIIYEYTSNNNKIEEISKLISESKNELDDKYRTNSENQEINIQYENELLQEFNKIIVDQDEYNNLNIESIDSKIESLEDIIKDKKATLSTFIASYEALENSGISIEENREYKSYVDDAKEDYYKDVDKKYMLMLYKLILDKKTTYEDIYKKREDITNLLNERLSLRKDLGISSFDSLSGLYDIVCDEFGVIKSQKYVIDSIDNLILSIDNYENEIKELTTRNTTSPIIDVVSEYIFNTTDNSLSSNKESILDTIVENIEEPKLEEENIQEEDTIYQDNEVVSVEDAVDLDYNMVSLQAMEVMKRVVDALDIDLDVNKEDIITVEDNTDDIFTYDNPTTIEDKPGVITKEVPTTEKNIFESIDPFLDDNDLEEKNTNNSSNTPGLEMPDIDKIGSVKPTNTLSKIERITKDNPDLILPSLGLVSNNKDVSLISDNYLSN